MDHEYVRSLESRLSWCERENLNLHAENHKLSVVATAAEEYLACNVQSICAKCRKDHWAHLQQALAALNAK